MRLTTRRKRPIGFTLLELLVVAALLALLAALLLPALAHVKGMGQAISCQNQVRQLSLAWTLYTDDAQQVLPFNLGSAEIRQQAARGIFQSWSSSVMSWELDPDNTNTVRVTEGGIGPYTSRRRSRRRPTCPSQSRQRSTPTSIGSWPARAWRRTEGLGKAHRQRYFRAKSFSCGPAST